MESYVNPNFEKATVDYKHNLFVNMGIAGAWREHCYKNIDSTFNKIMYWLLGFIIDDQILYKFDHTVV